MDTEHACACGATMKLYGSTVKDRGDLRDLFWEQHAGPGHERVTVREAREVREGRLQREQTARRAAVRAARRARVDA